MSSAILHGDVFDSKSAPLRRPIEQNISQLTTNAFWSAEAIKPFALVKRKFKMNKLLSTKAVILVADHDCAVAIMYQTSYRSTGVFKDPTGHLWTAFEYNDILEELILDYERGDFHVTVPGYVEYYEKVTTEWNQLAEDFDNPVITEFSI